MKAILAALCSFAVPGCATAELRPTPVVSTARTPEELRRFLAEIADRTDPAAALERARGYDLLRAMKAGPEGELLARGDAADLWVLSQPAERALKQEAAVRLSRHFRERVLKPDLARSTFEGPLGDQLRRFIFGTIAAYFGEVAGRADHGLALESMAAVAEELADHASLKPESRDRWHQRSRLYALRAVDEAGNTAAPDPGSDAIKFCEFDASRRLVEATRAADYGTREKAARGDPERALEWYLLALCHFVVARETLPAPTPAQIHALGAQDIVVKSLSELLDRE